MTTVAATGEDERIVAKARLPFDDGQRLRRQRQRPGSAFLTRPRCNGPDAVTDVCPFHFVNLFASLAGQQQQLNDRAELSAGLGCLPDRMQFIIIENTRA
jgi:hypothetical protein